MTLNDKYRPDSWNNLVGQEHIIDFFTSLLKNPKKYPTSFILNGPYGIGKTSCARIFYNELNKIFKSKYIEYDLSVIGNKESLKDVKFYIDNLLKFTKDYKVIVFDEVQETSSQAQSLFMKTLEDNFVYDDQLRNIYFFFVTTNSDKLIDTIISRCVELNFNLISKKILIERLKYICDEENIKIKENELNKIIEYSRGHLRDALKLLDVYLINGELFNLTTCDIQNLLNGYLFDDIVDIDKIIIKPVNKLINDFNLVVLKYVEKNIDKKYFEVLKFMELYLKYKNNIICIEDFISVLKILKKFIVSLRNKK